MARFYDKRNWRDRTRLRVLKRDGYRCVMCGRSIAGKNQARVDHVTPLRQDNSRAHDLTNLRSLCATCDNKAREQGTIRRHPTIHGHDVNGMPVDPRHGWAP